VRITPAEEVATPVPSLTGLIDGVLPDPDDTDYAIVVEDLASGSRAAVNDAQAFPSASLYKLGVAWLIMRQVDAGALSLDDELRIQDEDTIEPEPAGGFGVGDTPSVREALGAMISASSNAAAHAFLRSLGRDAFHQEMDRIGLSQTRVPDDSLAVTSAGDIARLLRLIAMSPELSSASRAMLEQYMANIAPPDAVRDALPDSVEIIDKTGNLEDASNVGALLQSPRRKVILVVLDSGVDPGDARGVIAQTALAAYNALLQ
jgi:beta-lactamase class A